jgi:Recombination endonuclease VII
MCPRCRKTKPRSEFWLSSTNSSGLQSHCKPCQRTRVRKHSRRRHLRLAYGMTPEDYQAMVKKQKGLCPICLHKRRLHVDHDHETGVVRGLLCSGCNSAVGLLDQPRRLRRAMKYLNREA